MVGGMHRRYPQYKLIPVDWLPTLPSCWSARRLKFCANLVNAKVADAEQDFYVALENVESSTGRHLPSEAPSEPESVVTRFAIDDVLFGKLRPYLAKAWKAERSGVCSTEFFVLRGKQYTPAYLRWLCLSPGFVRQVDSSTFGSKMPRASWDNVGELPTPLPSLSEQHAIAAFLDRETARIDALIEKKRRLIELLQEKRAAVVMATVTKGLNMGAPLSDSGVAWLGPIPAHWSLRRFKHVTTRVDVGIAEAATHAYADDGVPLIRSTDVFPNELRTSGLLAIEQWFAQRNRNKALCRGDLVTVRTGAPGTTAVVPDALDGCQCFTLLMSTVSRRHFSPYFCYYLNSLAAATYFQLAGWGTAQINISVPILKETPIPVPPLPEQRAIAKACERYESHFRAAITATGDAIATLAEFRSALISAAVTGQIDVREAA